MDNQSENDECGIKFRLRSWKRKKEDEDAGSIPSTSLDKAHNKISKRKPSTPIPFLPYEVLEHLFVYLSLEDQKNIRATCKFWREACSTPLITKHQKFIIRGNGEEYNPSSVQNAMIHGLFADVEFQSVGPLAHLDGIWEECGPKLDSLRLRECTLSEGTILNICRSCVNLTSLYIYGFVETGAFVHSLNKLVEDKIQLTKLHTLNMLPGPLIDKNMFQNIVFVFPNVKHVSLSFQLGFYYRKTRNPQTNWISQMKSLSIQLHPQLSIYLRQNVLLIPRGEFRLEKFETEMKSVYDGSQEKTYLFNFLADQNGLRILNLRINQSDCLENIIFHSLRSCPALREFRIGDQNTLLRVCRLNMNAEVITELLRLMQNLECFVSSSFYIHVNPLPNSHANPLPNAIGPKLALRTLSLRCSASNEELIVHILKHCPDVEHLHIFEAAESALGEIFKSMLNLRTLVVELQDKCQRVIFESEQVEHSIERLQKLERLALMFCSTGIMKSFMGKFRLPNVKHLSFSLPDNQIFFSGIKEFSSNLPELQSLALFCHQTLNPDGIGIVCKSFPGLKYLWATLILNPHIDHALKLDPVFRKHPQLKCISDQSHAFFRDTFTNGQRVISSQLHKVDFPSKSHTQYKILDNRSVFLFDNSWILNNFFWKYRY